MLGIVSFSHDDAEVNREFFSNTLPFTELEFKAQVYKCLDAVLFTGSYQAAHTNLISGA